MGSSGLLFLGLVLNVAHCLETLGSEPLFEVSSDITAVLGEDVYLSCRYLGESPILGAEWRRKKTFWSKARRLAGIYNDQPFSREDFSYPESLTNLTVRMKVSSAEAEGEYVCEFYSEEEHFVNSVFVTVVARPDIHTEVHAETIDGIHYQSVSCLAEGGRPIPEISWLVNGLPPSGFPTALDEFVNGHANGTSTVRSTFSFPTHLQDEDNVACVVQHPTLPNNTVLPVTVETYTRPNVTIKAEMVREGGSDFWVVSCVSSGGRPDTDIFLALSATEELQGENDTDSDMQKVSARFPATEYEGHNVTCVFDHPKFTREESRVFSLPTFYLSGVSMSSQLRGRTDDDDDDDDEEDDDETSALLELQEGQTDAVISLLVTGNVPRYDITCKKDDGPLPESVEVVGRNLTVQGPVERQHAGLYECVVSFHHLKATLQINVTVKPQLMQLVPPKIGVDLRSEGGLWVIECSATDAVPAANVSWLPPEGVPEAFWFNSSSHNGSHSVRGVLLLPACSPRELAAECVINHPAFEEPENRSVPLPQCAHPNITINVSSEWNDGQKYFKVDCSADSVAPPVNITWHVGDTDDSVSAVVETEVLPFGLVLVKSSLYFPSSLYAGQNLTCRVMHPSLETPERILIYIPVQKAPLLRVSAGPQQGSRLWLAQCDSREEVDGANLAWLLPPNTKGQPSLHSEYDGHTLKARLTYEFPLDRHEGQDLTCVYQVEQRISEKRTIHIPRYYISSVEVLNHTTPLQSRYGGGPVIHRVSLHENHHNQKILLHVEGKVPEYTLICRRSDGSSVPMDGSAMVFRSEPKEKDEGLYVCSASFYHHTATVWLQVEVTSEAQQLLLLSLILISSASALLLVLVVVLCVFCKRRPRPWHKDSLAGLTSLMQEPGSPEVKKPGKPEKDRKECAQLVRYSIVIDVKSTV